MGRAQTYVCRELKKSDRMGCGMRVFTAQNSWMSGEARAAEVNAVSQDRAWKLGEQGLQENRVCSQRQYVNQSH